MAKKVNFRAHLEIMEDANSGTLLKRVKELRLQNARATAAEIRRMCLAEFGKGVESYDPMIKRRRLFPMPSLETFRVVLGDCRADEIGPSAEKPSNPALLEALPRRQVSDHNVFAPVFRERLCAAIGESAVADLERQTRWLASHSNEGGSLSVELSLSLRLNSGP